MKLNREQRHVRVYYFRGAVFASNAPLTWKDARTYWKAATERASKFRVVNRIISLPVWN